MKKAMLLDRAKRARSPSSSQQPPDLPSSEEPLLSKIETKLIADSIYDFLDWFLKDEKSGDPDEESPPPRKLKVSKARKSVFSKKQTLLDAFSDAFADLVPPPAARKSDGNSTSERPRLVTAVLQSVEEDQDGDRDVVVNNPQCTRKGFSHRRSVAKRGSTQVSLLPPVWEDYYQILQSSIQSGDLPPDTRHPRGFLSWCVHQQWVYKTYHKENADTSSSNQVMPEAATSRPEISREAAISNVATASTASSIKSAKETSDTETEDESPPENPAAVAKTTKGTKIPSLRTAPDTDENAKTACDGDEKAKPSTDEEKIAPAAPDETKKATAIPDADEKAPAAPDADENTKTAQGICEKTKSVGDEEDKLKTAATEDANEQLLHEAHLKTQLSHLTAERIAKLNQLGFEWENAGPANDLLVDRPVPFPHALELYGPILLASKTSSRARRFERRSRSGREMIYQKNDLEKAASEWMNEQICRYREWDAGFTEFPLVEREALANFGLLPELSPSKHVQESLLALSDHTRQDSSVANSDDNVDDDDPMRDSSLIPTWMRQDVIDAVSPRVEDSLFDKDIEIPTFDTTKYEEKFDAKYQELKKFRRKYGHVRVTTILNRPLANWIRKQRARFRDLGDAYPADRKAKLDELGLDWSPKGRKLSDGPPPAGTGYAIIEAKWQKHLSNLKKFKEKFGHVNITKKWKHLFPGLTVWVHHQKEYYRNWKLGRFDLPDHRRIALEEIGLCGPNAVKNTGKKNSVYVEKGGDEKKSETTETNETAAPKRAFVHPDATRKSPRHP